MLLRARQRQARRETIERLYGAIVAQARLPSFYTDYAVPDTMEGRFDLVVLHVHLFFRRLAGEGTEARETGQKLFEYFLSDMDAALREMGTGDLKVPKKMRDIGEAYYGRANAYEAALAEQDNSALETALERNVLNGAKRDDAAQRLARYVRAAAAALGAQDTNEIVTGILSFPDPEKI